MPSILNSDDGVVSGTSGLKSTGGNDGLLNIQSNGSTVVAMTGSGVSVTGTLTASGATTLSGAVSASSLSVNSNNISATNSLGFRNRIINGAMVIDQRNAGASFTPSDGNYTLDRWAFFVSQSSKLTTQQSSVAPAGFTNSLLVTSSSAYSSGTNDYFVVQQTIEGYNVADMGFGAAGAATFTLSFWVRSSLTGTFGGGAKNLATNANRSYPFTYTINSANTWEQKTVTIAGDTTGTWDKTTGSGLCIDFNLGTGTTYSGTAGAWAGTNYLSATGAVSVVGTNGATWYITGVQLEVGTVATPFERRPYGTELALCQRYYFTRGGETASEVLGPGLAYSTTGVFGVSIPFPTVMRTTPTFSISSASHWAFTNSTGSGQTASTLTTDATEVSSKAGIVRGSVASGLSAGNCTILYALSSSARANWSAEL